MFAELFPAPVPPPVAAADPGAAADEEDVVSVMCAIFAVDDAAADTDGGQ